MPAGSSASGSPAGSAAEALAGWTAESSTGPSVVPTALTSGSRSGLLVEGAASSPPSTGSPPSPAPLTAAASAVLPSSAATPASGASARSGWPSSTVAVAVAEPETASAGSLPLGTATPGAEAGSAGDPVSDPTASEARTTPPAPPPAAGPASCSGVTGPEADDSDVSSAAARAATAAAAAARLDFRLKKHTRVTLRSRPCSSVPKRRRAGDQLSPAERSSPTRWRLASEPTRSACFT